MRTSPTCYDTNSKHHWGLWENKPETSRDKGPDAHWCRAVPNNTRLILLSWASRRLKVETLLKRCCSPFICGVVLETQWRQFTVGPRKDTERFGCNSHIGQLNATTSALSLPFAYGIHMLMMSLVFFFFSSCVCACVFVCCLFLSCVFFSPPCTSSPPPVLFVSPNKKMQKIWIHTSSFWERKLQIHPSYFYSVLLGD